MGRYLVVWLALLALTGATLALSRLDLGGFALPVAMGIALLKSTLVALFFMHLWDERGGNRLVLVVSSLFVLILIGGAVADVKTRFEYARPREDLGRSPRGAPARSPVP